MPHARRHPYHPGHEPVRIGGETRIRHYRVALSCFYAIWEDWFTCH